MYLEVLLGILLNNIIYNSLISPCLQNVLHSETSLYTLQSMSQHLFHVEAVEKAVSCLSIQGICSLRELLTNNYGKGSEEMEIYSSLARSLLPIYPEINMPVFHQMHTA